MINSVLMRTDRESVTFMKHVKYEQVLYFLLSGFLFLSQKKKDYRHVNLVRDIKNQYFITEAA